MGQIGLSERPHAHEEIVDYGQAQRSRKPQYSLVPMSAFDAMAARFELGEKKHGGTGKAWNARSPNRESALTKEWTRAAMEHVISHALIAMRGRSYSAARCWRNICG
jgi:hypothetical protein